MPPSRERVEGEALPYDPGSIPAWSSYPEIQQAGQIAQEVGEDNVRAAYFMGHTELLGGGDYDTSDAAAHGHYVVPTSGQSVASVAARTNIPVSELATLNSVSAGDRFPGGTQVNAPGTHHHVVIRFDIGVRIAEQYGIPFSLLSQANPGVDWHAIQPGQRLLIPRAN